VHVGEGEAISVYIRYKSSIIWGACMWGRERQYQYISDASIFLNINANIVIKM